MERRLVWATLAAAAVALALLRPRRVVVAGPSMLPALQSGDRLLVVRGRPRRGDVVALRHPLHPGTIAVKRVAAVPGDRHTPAGGDAPPLDAVDGYVVLGDNPDASTDSRAFGAVPAHALLGRAVYRYGPPDRRGALRPRRPRQCADAAP